MLISRRKEGQWIQVTHALSGDVLRIRLYDIRPGSAQMAFDDAPRNFEVRRPEASADDPIKRN